MPEKIFKNVTPALTRLGSAIVDDYIPRRLGRGADDITDTPLGKTLLSTLNGNLAASSAAAMLGRRGGSVGGRSTSAAKQAASRANGAKGGRPRKRD